MTGVAAFEREDDVLSLSDEDHPPYSQEFLEFIDEATSIYHSCAFFTRKLEEASYEYIKESDVSLSAEFYYYYSPAH
jgi:aspartyl aminopeptidase